jgi:hypothetical protein
MSEDPVEIAEANTSLIIGLFATLARKGVLTPDEAIEIVEQSTLRLEELGAPNGPKGRTAYAYLIGLRAQLSNIFRRRP